MERRTFVNNTALFAIAISTSGFVRFDGHSYVGDCETTTDILGPFYRPNSPLRNSLSIKGEMGDSIELIGKINHNDCTTPYPKAKIELWHCDARGVYDNTSQDYRYRGTTYSDSNGNYNFNTILPVPYDVGDGTIRPAHFHMMISATGYQPLVTQLYFIGDDYLDKDESASSPTAKKRILSVERLNNGSKKVVFDVNMSQNLSPESAAIDKLVGVYTDDKKLLKKVFFNKDNALWMKNELYGVNFNYLGDNTFTLPGIDTKRKLSYHFEILSLNTTRLTISELNENGKKKIRVLTKEKI
ncbi:catechol 1,2-dioxygenase [Arenibacter sp. TNZ]|jgi:protocatechuate 3,4-dioxygenase beta subunit|uniref:dioxygenase family protein n=1 Tax=Arenibacter TaxID=178469 RepID=UPI000CD48C40|nr:MULTISPECIES: catechol 1,2-dioxygenase [Arenibacter]MCM4171404.1 catechol 1,2-dioxygenase [Arenibacter sp. TNZ]